MSGYREPGWPDLSFLEEAAAQARKESERWLAGAGSKYPKHPMPWWPIGGEEADETLQERRHRRQRERR